jgi:ribosomal protein S18 acetylase RimI-like enzyme
VNPSVTLRPAVAADLPWLTSVAGRLGAVPLPPWRTASEVASADLRQIIATLDHPTDSSLLLIAERSAGEPLGCLFVTLENDFFTGRLGAHIEVVAVTAEAEGQGVARRLLQAAEPWARDQGCDHVTLNVFVGNARARAVYESLGFTPETVRYYKAV